MKKCACIETLFLDIPFAERFQAAKDAGFDSVEFWSWTDKDLPQIGRLASAADIPITAFSGDQDYSLIDPDHSEAYIAFAKQSLKTAQELGCGTLVMHSNAMDGNGHVLNEYHHLSDSTKLLNMYETLRRLAPFAEEAGVTLVLEALNVVTDHKGYYLQNTAVSADIVRTIGSPRVRILYDIYHMQLNEGKIADTIALYAAYMGHVHIADVPGRNEPGTGEINYPFVVQKLEQAGYQGELGFELFAKGPVEDAVAAMLAL